MSSFVDIQARIRAKRKAADSMSVGTGRTAKRWRRKGDIEDEAARAYYAAREVSPGPNRIQSDGNVRSGSSGNRACTDGEVDASVTTHESDVQHSTEQGHAYNAVPTNRELGKHTRMNVEREASVEDNIHAGESREGRQGSPPMARKEVVRRLRLLKQPATLFGEEEWERFHRLRDVELHKETDGDGQRNIYQNKLREIERRDAVRDKYEYSGAVLPQTAAPTCNEIGGAAGEAGPQSANCPEDYIYTQIRRWMNVWQGEVDGMAADARRTRAGRTAAVTLEQTKEWLKPLIKKLRKRKLSVKIREALQNIFEAVDKREYVEANSFYYEQLAIGNAPWPMGATMVGIHARAAREKIGEDKIAHVMNDEQSRKYIQGVKRLMTLAQTNFPTTPSKMIQS